MQLRYFELGEEEQKMARIVLSLKIGDFLEALLDLFVLR